MANPDLQPNNAGRNKLKEWQRRFIKDWCKVRVLKGTRCKTAECLLEEFLEQHPRLSFTVTKSNIQSCMRQECGVVLNYSRFQVERKNAKNALRRAADKELQARKRAADGTYISLKDSQ
jgi:hypothetical protein